MAYRQLKTFNQVSAGKVPGMCLRNVRLGYGIASKYSTAWQAWLNASRFTSDIPAGVDVPVYFSYTTTIGGVKDNYGHIGVRLANGKFWSDGKTYLNLSAYRLTHPSVHYVGWSDEVNDVKVLEYYVPAPSKMPPVGSRVKFTVNRTAFVAGTTTVKGTLTPDIRIVRGYDPKYPNRILVNSASVGNGVAVALYYTNGTKIDGWTQL